MAGVKHIPPIPEGKSRYLERLRFLKLRLNLKFSSVNLVLGSQASQRLTGNVRSGG
jgi:hypothetical protein